MQGSGNGKDLKAAVLGAAGQLGALVVKHLRDLGVDVVEISRPQGVDACSSHGLDTACAGVSTVVDWLNLETLSRKRAVDFSATTARRVPVAAERAGASRIVCVSILNARVPAAHRWMGYSAGKAAQERASRPLEHKRIDTSGIGAAAPRRAGSPADSAQGPMQAGSPRDDPSAPGPRTDDSEPPHTQCSPRKCHAEECWR